MRLNKNIQIFGIALIIVLAIGHIIIFCNVLMSESKIRKINDKISVLREDNNLLQEKLLSLKTTKRIEKIAKYLGFTIVINPQTFIDDTIALR